MADPRIPQYESWLARLERSREAFAGNERRYKTFFGGLVAVATLGFFINWLVGIWAVVCSCFVGFCAMQWRKIRLWEFTSEIEDVRRRLDEMRRVSDDETGPTS